MKILLSNIEIFLMNAIVTLNVFCEVHGPQVIFTTQTLRDQLLIQSKNEELKAAGANITSQELKNICDGCSSIGNAMIFKTEDKESSILFVSSQKTLFSSEIVSLLKSTAMRSLSCEVTSENLVFFGDDNSNSLSLTFKVKDSQSRGFEKLYSIVIVMKDKMFLLNTQPFLAKNLKESAKHIKDFAEKVFESDQTHCSPRAERIHAGKASNVPPRSLKELTGQLHIFAHLHSLFSWMLWAGGRYFTEVLTLGTPSVPPTMRDDVDEGFTFVQIDKEEFLMRHYQSACENEDSDGISYDLRRLRDLCDSPILFKQLIYCSIIGVQIVIRGKIQKSTDFLKFFKSYLPQILHCFIFESTKYVPVEKCRILALPPDAAIPNNNICRVDLMNDNMTPSSIRCPIDLPTKLPQLMTKILHGVEEKLFSVTTLEKFLRAATEEWKNHVMCFSFTPNDTSKLKKVLGISVQDELLINYWLKAF